jgi:hypothetical protein
MLCIDALFLFAILYVCDVFTDVSRIDVQGTLSERHGLVNTEGSTL